MIKKGRHFDRQNSQRGSASILVIMLSLTLVVFGVFSMMTAHAGLAVARRHGEWTSKHYEVESRAALVAAETHQMVKAAAVETSNTHVHLVDFQEHKNHLIKSLEEKIGEKQLSVTLIGIEMTAEKAVMVIQTEISLLPPPEERNGFYGVLAFTVDLSERNQPWVAVDKMVWKAVTEDFEYREGIEFRDVEVEGQVE